MKLLENGRDGAEPVHMSWDAAQAALASEAYVLAPASGDRDIDQPSAQSPAPGTDPKDGKEQAADGSPLTNLTPVAAPAQVSGGLPKEPPPPNPPASTKPVAPTPAPALAPKPEQK